MILISESCLKIENLLRLPWVERRKEDETKEKDSKLFRQRKGKSCRKMQRFMINLRKLILLNSVIQLAVDISAAQYLIFQFYKARHEGEIFLLLSAKYNETSSDDKDKGSGGKGNGDNKESGEKQNGGSNDSGSKDSGSKDSGSKDSGSKDSGSSDSGSKDSGSSDSGSKDSGSKDSGSKDSGSTDSGGKDSGGKDGGNQQDGSNKKPSRKRRDSHGDKTGGSGDKTGGDKTGGSGDKTGGDKTGGSGDKTGGDKTGDKSKPNGDKSKPEEDNWGKEASRVACYQDCVTVKSMTVNGTSVNEYISADMSKFVSE